MPRAVSWSLRWQILAAMLVALAATLLLYSALAGNLLLATLDRDLAARLELVASLAEKELPLERMRAYAPGDETLDVYRQDASRFAAFAVGHGLDRLTLVSRQGRVHLDSHFVRPGGVLPAVWLPGDLPGRQLTRLHRDRAGAWQKSLWLPTGQDRWLRLAAGSEMLAVIDRMSQRRLWMLSLGLALALALSWGLTVLLGRRLTRLTRAFRALQEGEAGVRVTLPGRDEVAFLGRAFNDMAAELETKTRRERLQYERRVNELKVLSAGVAHEIRNPLAAISSLVDFLARKVEAGSTPEALDLVQKIRGEINRLDRIVSEILAYARQPRLLLAPLDAAALQAEVRALDPACRISVADELPPASADHAGLLAVLRNLVTNAREAAGPGGEVALSLGADAEGIRLEVTDNGPGVPPDQAEKIFQPFFSGKPQGTGLGLAIARNIMEAHGGRLELAPSSRGARFVAVLPFLQEV
ncbi:MAG: ATP-binding protein [candidate division FCPU426 bacterium]